MQEEALEVWREIEQRTGKEILVTTGMLWILHPSSQTFKNVSAPGQKGEVLSNAEMKKRYPALVAMPDDFVGFLAPKAGVVRANVGLHACKKLALEQGADLRYNSPVKAVDIMTGTVVLACGKIYRGKQIVISCGPLSD